MKQQPSRTSMGETTKRRGPYTTMPVKGEIRWLQKGGGAAREGRGPYTTTLEEVVVEQDQCGQCDGFLFGSSLLGNCKCKSIGIG
jgi:hypothetical protein